MPTLEVRFICLPRASSSRNRRFFAPAPGCAHSRNAQQSGNEKGNLSYLAIIRQCAKFHLNAKKEREHIK
jgi:hypothetical protein